MRTVTDQDNFVYAMQAVTDRVFIIRRSTLDPHGVRLMIVDGDLNERVEEILDHGGDPVGKYVYNELLTDKETDGLIEAINTARG